MSEKVILVDEDDNRIGTEEKLKAHQDGGQLHRCFSIFVFNSEGEMLLQKRADSKYHSPGLLTNTCCSHPRPGEGVIEAGERRLQEEMGFSCDLEEAFNFTYKEDVGKGLTEWEFDHVLIGEYNNEPDPNPKEASDWKWVGLDELEKDLEKNPEKYTPWFKICVDKVIDYVRS